MRIFQMRDLGDIEAYVMAADYDRAFELFEQHVGAHGGDPDSLIYRELELHQINDEGANDAIYVALDFDCEGLVICDADGRWAFVRSPGC